MREFFGDIKMKVTHNKAFLLLAFCFALASFRAYGQFSDDFNGSSINTSIWTVLTEPGFSITQANGALTFDADNINDPSDANFTTYNFDNQWDKANLLSIPFPRAQNGIGTQITF